MPQLMVTKRLNRRSVLPTALPDDKNIIDTVPKGYIFFGNEIIPGPGMTLPPPPLDKWYKDSDGFFYWGGALMVVKNIATETHPPTPVSGVSALQIKFATGAFTSYAEKFATFINDTCARFQINTPARALCFLAQVGHESGGLFYTEELASGKAYEGRADLGNTNPGDGVRYKGRGLIQITGRANYTSISNELGIDCVNNPSLLGGKDVNKCTTEQLNNAALSAGWFWNSRKLNDIADKVDITKPIEDDQNLAQFKAITKKINGGYNGLSDRVMRYKAGVSLFT
jgi:putative chitinase